MRIGAFNIIERSSQLSLETSDTEQENGTRANPMYPLSNLVDPATFKEFRSASGQNSATITVNAGYFARFDSVFLCGNRATGELNFTKVVIKASPTDVKAQWNLTTPIVTYEVNASDHINNFVFIPVPELDPLVGYQYWQLTFTNDAGSYVGLSNLFLGNSKLISTLQADHGIKFAKKSNSEVFKGRYNQSYIDIVNSTQELELEFSFLNREEFQALDDIVNYADIYRPIWILISEDDADIGLDVGRLSGIYRLKELPKPVAEYHSLFTTSLSLEEVI